MRRLSRGADSPGGAVAILVVAGGAFLALTLAVAGLDVAPLDVPLRQALLARATPDLLAAMRAINLAGSWKLLLPATLLLVLAVPRARARWWLWIALMLVAPMTEGALKIVVGRPRPEALSPGFPSGHATAAAAFGGAVIYFAGRLPPLGRRLVRALAVILVALVALARVLLRAHWPIDAVAGVCLGAALAAAAVLLDRRLGRRAGPRPLVGILVAALVAAAAAGGARADDECGRWRAAFAGMATRSIALETPRGAIPLQVRVADTDETRAAGFQCATTQEIRRTLILFDFDGEILTQFHMRNVPAPLDIAFAKADGRVFAVLRMEPSDTALYGPMGSFRYALEARAGFFERHGVRPHDARLVVRSAP